MATRNKDPMVEIIFKRNCFMGVDESSGERILKQPGDTASLNLSKARVLLNKKAILVDAESKDDKYKKEVASLKDMKKKREAAETKSSGK